MKDGNTGARKYHQTEGGEEKGNTEMEIAEILAFEMKLKRINIKKTDEGGRITWGCEECNWENTEKENNRAYSANA